MKCEEALLWKEASLSGTLRFEWHVHQKTNLCAAVLCDPMVRGFLLHTEKAKQKTRFCVGQKNCGPIHW